MVVAFLNGILVSQGNFTLTLNNRGTLQKGIRLFTKSSNIDNVDKFNLYSKLLNYLGIHFTSPGKNSMIKISSTKPLINLIKLLLDNSILVFNFNMPVLQLMYETLLLYPIRGYISALNKKKVDSNVLKFAEVKKTIKANKANSE